MNKYLATFYDIESLVEKQLIMVPYEGITKCEMADELDYILEWDDFNNFELTDTQQEQLIDVVYSLYACLDSPPQIFYIVKATAMTALDFGTFDNFMEAYRADRDSVEDKIIWRF